MFRRLEDIYKAQARRALEAGCGGRTVYDLPVDLEPAFDPSDTDSKWFSSVTRLLTLPSRRQDTPVLITPESNLSFLQLRISDKDDTTPASAEQLLVGLGQALGPMAFEVVGHDEQTVFQFVCRETQQAALEGLLSVQYPNSQVISTSGDALAQAVTDTELVLTEYNLNRSHAYMLKTFTSFKGVDPLSVALGALEELPTGGFGAVQILFRRVDDRWRDHLRRASSDPFDASLPALPEEGDLVACAEKKAESPFFAVAVRLIGSERAIIEHLVVDFRSSHEFMQPAGFAAFVLPIPAL